MNSWIPTRLQHYKALHLPSQCFACPVWAPRGQVKALCYLLFSSGLTGLLAWQRKMPWPQLVSLLPHTGNHSLTEGCRVTRNKAFSHQNQGPRVFMALELALLQWGLMAQAQKWIYFKKQRLPSRSFQVLSCFSGCFCFWRRQRGIWPLSFGAEHALLFFSQGFV